MANVKSIKTETFSSITSFLTTINSREKNDEMRNDNSSHRTNDDSFFHTKNYEEATELITKGWTDKLSEIKKQFSLSIKSNANGQISKRRTYNHVEGYAPHVPNAILGLPQSMINTQAIPQKVKTVSIVYSPTSNCGTSVDTYIKAGIVILSIVNQLELNGVRVNLVIDVKDCRSFDDHYAGAFVTIKNYREALDLKKVAFPIAHPSMQRRFGFKWLETVPELKSGFSRGYGTTVSGEEGHKDFLVKIGIIKDTDYFFSLDRIEQLKFDISAIMNDAEIQI